jgi:hypothetical protein
VPINDNLGVGITAGLTTGPTTSHVGRFDDRKDRICWGVKILEGCDVSVFRGSATFEDWRCDLMCGPIRSAIANSARSIPAFCSGSIRFLKNRQKGSRMFVAGRFARRRTRLDVARACRRGRDHFCRAGHLRRAASRISAARFTNFQRAETSLPSRARRKRCLGCSTSCLMIAAG